MITKVSQSHLETEFGPFEIVVYCEEDCKKEHVVLIKEWGDATPLVRVHSECATGDIFGSTFCDCRGQLHEAMKKVQEEGGALVYLRQEGRGLGLGNKIKAYALQHEGLDTVEANEAIGRGVDERGYEFAEVILKDLGISSLRLMTNNPKKVQALRDAGFQVERVEHVVEVGSERGKKYLQTKRDKMGHEL